MSVKLTLTKRKLCSEVFRRKTSVKASDDIDGRFERLSDVRRVRLSLLGGKRLLKLNRQLSPFSERCVSEFGRFANKLGGRYTLGSDSWDLSEFRQHMQTLYSHLIHAVAALVLYIDL